MKQWYIEVLEREEDGDILIFNHYIGGPHYHTHLEQEFDARLRGYKVLSIKGTTDKVEHFKDRLSARLLELRRFTETSEKILKEASDGVREETKDIIEEGEKSLMCIVARIYDWLLQHEADMEEVDELAIECHNYWVSTLKEA